MIPQEINIAIAEWCGGRWYECKTTSGLIFSLRKYEGYKETVRPINPWVFAFSTDSSVPDYFHDLNAVHEAVDNLDADEQENFEWELVDVTKAQLTLSDRVQLFVLAQATAPQRCEALLRTINKWIE